MRLQCILIALRTRLDQWARRSPQGVLHLSFSFRNSSLHRLAFWCSFDMGTARTYDFRPFGDRRTHYLAGPPNFRGPGLCEVISYPWKRTMPGTSTTFSHMRESCHSDHLPRFLADRMFGGQRFPNHTLDQELNRISGPDVARLPWRPWKFPKPLLCSCPAAALVGHIVFTT